LSGQLTDWKARFDLAAGTRSDLNSLVRMGADPNVILELLFHHVRGEYGLGFTSRSWEAFCQSLSATRQVALKLASDLDRFSTLKVFSLPPILATFWAHNNGRFMWEHTETQQTCHVAGC
jgi:hypothetical protein